jgi:hypothetical protein
MTTDTNNAASLPICPICGKSSGFAKGFGRRFSLSMVQGVMGNISQPQCSLDGLDIIAELEKTRQWIDGLKSGQGATYDEALEIFKAENLLACNNSGCRIDFDKKARRQFRPPSLEHGTTRIHPKDGAAGYFEHSKNRQWRKRYTKETQKKS